MANHFLNVFLTFALGLWFFPHETIQTNPPEAPGKTLPDQYIWHQQGKRFFDCSRIVLQTNFREPTKAELHFDDNAVWYDDFGDWVHTLKGVPEYTCRLERIAREDPINRRLYRVILPEQLSKKLPEQELRLALSAPDDKRVFIRLLLVKKGIGDMESVEQVANFRAIPPKSARDKTEDEK